MRNLWKTVYFGFLLSAMSVSAASSEGATFESFYVPGLTIGFLGWAAIVVVTVATVAIVAISGGAASPVVASIGGYIGGAFGLTGVAATNFGLALLGGGALSTGGFGMAGGIAVLTAALTFSGEVVFSYVIEGGIHHFESGRFEKDSRAMIKLPPVRTADGPAPYEKAMAILKGIDLKKCLDGEENEPILKKALVELEKDHDGLKDKDRCRVDGLRAIIYSQLNDYYSAAAAASKSIECGTASKVGVAVPLFIKALCVFAERDPNINNALEGDFKEAIRCEPKNKLIPMLYSIILDRFQYRYVDGAASAKDLEVFCDIIDDKAVSVEVRDVVMTIIYARTVSLLKLDQQAIYGVGRTASNSLKENPRVKEDLEKHLHCYEVLVEICERKILPKLAKSSKVKESSEMIKNSAPLIAQYKVDTLNLAKVVAEFGVGR